VTAPDVDAAEVRGWTARLVGADDTRARRLTELIAATLGA
jgi:hypothetical protein